MKNFYFNTNLNIAKELLKEIITKHKNNDLKLEHKDNKVILYDYTKQSIYKIKQNTEERIGRGCEFF